MMKKLITILIISSVLMGLLVPSFGDTEGNVENKVYEVEYLNALKIAQENNKDLKIIEDKIKLAERRLYIAKADADSAIGKHLISTNDRIENGKVRELYPAQKQWELDKLLQEKKDKIKEIQVGVTEKFVSIEQKQDAIENQKLSIKTLETEYSNQKKKVELGLETTMNLMSTENRVSEAKYNLSKVERQLSQLVMDLNRLMGVELDQNTVLGKNVVLSYTVKEYDLNELVKSLNENSLAVQNKAKTLEFAELELAIVNRESTIEIPKATVESLEDNIIIYKSN